MTPTSTQEQQMERQFDVVVVGGGPTGENVADYATRGGLSAVIVEAELLGGECSYWACMPSKALLRTPEAVAAARRLPGVEARFAPEAVLTRRTAFASNWRDDGQFRWAQRAGVEVVRGWGRLVAERVVEVTTTTGSLRLRAEHAVVLCTGSVPVVPAIPGLDAVSVWTSREATSASRVPARLGVIGGGPVGCELAQAWRRLGSEVVLFHHGRRLLSAMEPFAGQRVATALRDDGVDVRVGSTPDSVEPRGGGRVAVRTGDQELVVDELLVATGRRPRIADIGLEEIGVHCFGHLEVDDSGLVEAADGRWLYAAGDVTERSLLTHQGKYAARIVGAAIAARAAGERTDTGPWGEHAAWADHVAVPQVVFTDPQVATVGRTLDAARRADEDVRVIDLPISVAGSALHAEGYNGWVRTIVDNRRDVVVGMTFVGQDVAELLFAATAVIVGEVPLSRLWHAVPAYPTMSEVWLRVLEADRASESGLRGRLAG
jgi:pyruvate/2-oxoglutarate dehydrogenase complex dihydrolipoamide dehydrogenase (E3) component